MKINSGFITNSSSASRTELYIKNYFLASILKKYKVEKSSWDVDLTLAGNGKIDLIWGTQDSINPGSSPDRSDVLALIIRFFDEDENKRLIAELENNSEKIISNMVEIDLKWEDQSWDGEEQDPYEVNYELRKDHSEYARDDYRYGMDESKFPKDADKREYFEETGGIYDPNFEAGDNWL